MSDEDETPERKKERARIRAGHIIYNTQTAAVLLEKIEAQAARIAELEAMVKDAYNAGFTEGMKEHTSSRGGIPWHDSRFRAALEKDKAE